MDEIRHDYQARPARRSERMRHSAGLSQLPHVSQALAFQPANYTGRVPAIRLAAAACIAQNDNWAQPADAAIRHVNASR
jgi:hypothetical protein